MARAGIILSAALAAAVMGCAGTGERTWSHDGIAVPDPGSHSRVTEALDLIRDGEPVLYSLLKKHVKKIDISLYHEMSYPFYDYLYLAQAALDRGAGYTASVIGHELLHVVINGVRRNKAPAGDIPLLGARDLPAAAIPSLSKKQEEAIAYRFQEKLLLKFGSETDIEYHRLRMKAIYGKGK